MNTETIVALSKYLADQKATLDGPGTYNVNEEVRLRIEGTISKSQDVEYTPTTSVPWKIVTALLLEKMGIVREAASAMLVECCKEAIELERFAECGESKVVSNLKEKMNNVAQAEKRVQEIVEALPKKTRSGVTKVNVTVEMLPIIENQKTELYWPTSQYCSDAG